MVPSILFSFLGRPYAIYMNVNNALGYILKTRSRQERKRDLETRTTSLRIHC